jgi:hypothetical protein
MPDSDYVYEVEDIILEINRRTRRSIELFPFWKYPIWAGDHALFKLRDSRADLNQIMDLRVPAKDFSTFSGRNKLNLRAISRITGEIEEFFCSRPTKAEDPLELKSGGRN